MHPLPASNWPTSSFKLYWLQKVIDQCHKYIARLVGTLVQSDTALYFLCIWVYLYSPPLVHMGKSSRTVLVILYFGGKCKIQIQKDALIPEVSPGSLVCQVFKPSYTGPWFKDSSEWLISNFCWQARKLNPQRKDYKSRALTIWAMWTGNCSILFAD
jgi:hypothetical protein